MTVSGQTEQTDGMRAAAYERSDADMSRDAHTLFALLGLVKLLTVIIFLLTGAFWYVVHKGHPEDRFYAMSFDGRKMGLTGIKEPSLNTNAMLSWVAQATTQIMTFGFNDINERFAVSRTYFTESGWESFYAALSKSMLLKGILNEQQLMTAIPTKPAKILYNGWRNGDYVWDIEVPVVLTVRAGDVSKTAHPKVIVTVARVPTHDSPNGFGIAKWVLF